jgi:copper transport protein
MRRLALVLFLAALAAPANAFAHASVRATFPTYRERLEQPPRAVRIRFDQGVKAFPDSIVVRTAEGTIVSGSAHTLADPHTITVPLRSLPKGAYTIRWHALSSDGHTVSGVWTFGVRVAAPPPTEAYGASGPTRTEHIVRWLYFLALALVIGGIGFRLVVVRGPLPPRVETRFYKVVGLGVVAALEVGIAAFVLRAEDALQLPFGKLLYGDLSPVASGTRFGVAFIAMTLGFAVVAAIVFLAWLLERRALLWAAFALALGFASGLSLSGHSAADAGSSWKSELADWVHLSCASLWLGGLVQLGVVVWPLAPELRRSAFLRFSRLAPVLISLLLAGGIYLSVLRLPQVSDLWTASYGRILLVKLSLVCTALLWGAVHHFVAGPLVERGDARIGGRLSRSLLGEASVGMAILLVAAVLVDSKPPPQPSRPSPAAAPAGQSPAPPAAPEERENARDISQAVTVRR